MKLYIVKHLRKSLYEELINDIGQYVLATVFVWTYVGDLSIPHSIRQTVLNKLGNSNGQYRKEFNVSERGLLDNDTSPYKMDITLLYKLLTLVCTFAPKNSDAWTQLGHGGTHSLEFDLNAVKKLRNELAHERPMMTKEQFQLRITDIFNLYAHIVERAGVHSHKTPKEILSMKLKIEEKVNNIRKKYTTICYYLDSIIVLIIAVISLIILVIIAWRIRKEILSENIDIILGKVIESKFNKLLIKESVGNLTKYDEWRVTQGPKLEALPVILKKAKPYSIIVDIEENPTSLNPYLNESITLLCMAKVVVTLRLKFNYMNRISGDTDDEYLPEPRKPCELNWLQGHFSSKVITMLPSSLKTLMLRISSDDMNHFNDKLKQLDSIQHLNIWIDLDVTNIPEDVTPLHYEGQELRIIINGKDTLTDHLIDSSGTALGEYIAKLCPLHRLGGLEWLGFTYTKLTGKGAENLLEKLHKSGLRATGRTGGTVGLGISTAQTISHEENQKLGELAVNYGFIKYYYWTIPYFT